MSYDNNNRGAAWGNKDRQKDTHPHFKGKATVENVEYYVSAWKKGEGAKENAPSLTFQLTKVSDVKDKAINQANKTMAAPPPAMGDFGDEPPF